MSASVVSYSSLESVDITDSQAVLRETVQLGVYVHQLSINLSITEGKSGSGPYESKNRIRICGMHDSLCKHLFLLLIVLILGIF